MDEEFNALQYIASYGDLIKALGTNAAAGEQHYRQFGQREGRLADLFDEQQYLTNYPDLQAAFGSDGDAATLHYLQHGYREGRTDSAPLPEGFDGLQYIASNPDLISALGADSAAGARHYLAFGREEGRQIDTFDEQRYLANYPDLAATFGADGGPAATQHYITFGAAEGRSDGPLPSAADDAFGIYADSGPVRVDVLANDADGGVGPLRVVAVAVDTTDTRGVVELTVAGRIFYEPGDAFDLLPKRESGIDGFLYTVENGAGGRSTAFVEVTVEGVNDAPVAADDAFTVAENAGPTTLAVLVNDTDVDIGTALTIKSVGTGALISGDSRAIVFDPTPFNLAEGETTEVSVTYTAADPDGGEDSATVRITVIGVAEPAVPTAADTLF